MIDDEIIYMLTRSNKPLRMLDRVIHNWAADNIYHSLWPIFFRCPRYTEDYNLVLKLFVPKGHDVVSTVYDPKRAEYIREPNYGPRFIVKFVPLSNDRHKIIEGRSNGTLAMAHISAYFKYTNELEMTE